MTYKFTLDSPGTFWYHSHVTGQYVDGLRAPVIVENPSLPWNYTDEYVLSLSDWYHTQSTAIVNAFQSPPQGPPTTPTPDNIIMNDGVFSSYKMIPGHTYLFHILNVGGFPAFLVNFANVQFSVIGVDGTTTHNTSTPANTIYVAAAQRYRVLVVAPENPTTQGAFTAVVDSDMFESPYSGRLALVGTLDYGLATPSSVYNASLAAGTLSTTILPFADDLTFKPLTTVDLYTPVTKQFVLNFNFGLVDNIARGIINNSTYLQQLVPTLYTTLTAPQSLRNNSAIYGPINPVMVSYNDVVEIVINNLSALKHPWHLHGHQFQVVARGGANTTYDPSTADPEPMMRDVVNVDKNGYIVLRFRATNPGVQLRKFASYDPKLLQHQLTSSIVHCHIEWHVAAGLTATVIEAPEHMQQLKIPADATANCANGGYLSAGNAGGNTQDWTDSSNYVTTVPQVNNGALYTGKGSGSKAKRTTHVVRRPSRVERRNMLWSV
jgi:iron transport multicopper oxidase